MKTKLAVVLAIIVALSIVIVAYCNPSDRQACETIPGFESVSQKSILILGDYHGTNEPPRVAFDIACNMLAKARDGTVLVALELPVEFNRHFEHRNSGAVDEIKRNPFWAEFKDGRHSQAMLDLVLNLKDLSARSNGRLRIVAVEKPPIDSEGPSILSDAMKRWTPARTVVLVGNAHARKKIFAKAGVVPFGMTLASLGYEVTALDIKPGGGTAWFCKDRTCGPYPLRDIPTRSTYSIALDGCPNACPYDGSYIVPRLTVSKNVDVQP